MRPSSLQSSPRSISFSTPANLLDADGIKTTIATATSAITYSGATLNGAYANPGPAIPAPDGKTGVAQWPIAVAASQAGAYVDASTITFTGLYGGETVSRTATVVGTDGNATFVADGPLETCVSVTVEAQADTDGAWTFGFTDLGPRKLPGSTSEPAFRQVYGVGGNVSAVYSGGYTDLLVCPATGKDWTVEPTRIVQATTTATALTVLE